MKLKLDLHTHCQQANVDAAVDFVTGVRNIMAAIKARSLHGAAITDHWESEYAFRVKKIVECLFNNEVLIIPGQEIVMNYQHVIELYLPNNTTFRFIAHPRTWYRGWAEHLEGIHGLEIKNANPDHIFNIDEDKVREVAEAHGLLLLSNSDAHELNQIGLYYNEIDLNELYVLVSSST